MFFLRIELTVCIAVIFYEDLFNANQNFLNLHTIDIVEPHMLFCPTLWWGKQGFPDYPPSYPSTANCLPITPRHKKIPENLHFYLPSNPSSHFSPPSFPLSLSTPPLKHSNLKKFLHKECHKTVYIIQYTNDTLTIKCKKHPRCSKVGFNILFIIFILQQYNTVLLFHIKSLRWGSLTIKFYQHLLTIHYKEYICILPLCKLIIIIVDNFKCLVRWFGLIA